MQRPAKPFTPVRFRLQPPSIMKVGIIGFGFVGKAVASGLVKDVEIIKIDPKLNTALSDLKEFSPNIVFICVPTPMNEDYSQNITILEDTITALNRLDLNLLTVIKSTVLPDHAENIQNLVGRIVYNPEFLREKHAVEDFINSDLIIFGGEETDCKELGEFYNNYTKCINDNYIFTDVISASLIKYTINSFLATKVIFFNEINKIFRKSGTNETWDKFIKSISSDSRIGNSHMDVPGHDGRYGFGGACFPKDTNALKIYAENNGINMSLLKEVIKSNNNIRAKYNSETDREVDQNINFKGEN